MDSVPLCEKTKFKQKLNMKGSAIVIATDYGSSEGGIKGENRRNKI